MSLFATPPAVCPDGPHRGPQGPNEDVSVCPRCGSLSHALRPEGETFGQHLPDCSLPVRHEGHCQPGGDGHPAAPVIRGWWPGAAVTLQAPTADDEPPLGYVVTDARGERWDRQFDGWNLRYGAGRASWSFVLKYSVLPLTVTPPSPDALRRQADLIESQSCTGLAASWCPIHGNCGCPRDDEGGREDMNDPDCPLHSPESSHAAASVAECQGH